MQRSLQQTIRVSKAADPVLQIVCRGGSRTRSLYPVSRPVEENRGCAQMKMVEDNFSKNGNHTNNAQNNSSRYGKFFREITREAGGKKRFPKVADCSGENFLSSVINEHKDSFLGTAAGDIAGMFDAAGAAGGWNMEEFLSEKAEGQNENHPALKLGSSMNELPPNEVILNVSSMSMDVNSQIAGIRSASLMSEAYSLKMPLAGLKPASTSSLGRSFIQLSYRGIISNKSTMLICNQIVGPYQIIVKNQNWS